MLQIGLYFPKINCLNSSNFERSNIRKDSSLTCHKLLIFQSGIGLCLAHRILDEDDKVDLILACRNRTKADEARKNLLERHPGVTIDVVLFDTSSLTSVYNAAKTVRFRYLKG